MTLTEKPRYLVIDTETGGLDPLKYSLLSIAGVVWEPGRTSVRDGFYFFVNEPELQVSDTALEINNIDVEKIKHSGYSPWEAVSEIRKTLNRVFGTDREPVRLAGHNVGFDIAFLKRLYRLSGADYSKDFSHRSMDTSSILAFLMCAGHVPFGSAKSDFLFEFCGVTIPENERHTAWGDAVATFKSLTVLTERFGINATQEKEASS